METYASEGAASGPEPAALSPLARRRRPRINSQSGLRQRGRGPKPDRQLRLRTAWEHWGCDAGAQGRVRRVLADEGDGGGSAARCRADRAPADRAGIRHSQARRGPRPGLRLHPRATPPTRPSRPSRGTCTAPSACTNRRADPRGHNPSAVRRKPENGPKTAQPGRTFSATLTSIGYAPTGRPDLRALRPGHERLRQTPPCTPPRHR